MSGVPLTPGDEALFGRREVAETQGGKWLEVPWKETAVVDEEGRRRGEMPHPTMDRVASQAQGGRVMESIRR